MQRLRCSCSSANFKHYLSSIKGFCYSSKQFNVFLLFFFVFPYYLLEANWHVVLDVPYNSSRHLSLHATWSVSLRFCVLLGVLSLSSAILNNSWPGCWDVSNLISLVHLIGSLSCDIYHKSVLDQKLLVDGPWSLDCKCFCTKGQPADLVGHLQFKSFLELGV